MKPDAVQGDRLTIWVGSASGGVWKSVDGGLRFKPVFDKHTQSIGALKVDPRDPKTVWVGTGETCVRNSVSVGDGIYKTTDGGENWQKMGLADSERIAKIAIDPADPDRVFVCATGHLFDDHPDRGVYMSQNGGESWDKVLYLDDRHGVADLDIDPENPNVLYAGLWRFERKPWTHTSCSEEGGLWKSVDGGLVFKPVFDKHNQSIGAVTVDRRNPKTVWVGTGESCTRNNSPNCFC